MHSYKRNSTDSTHNITLDVIQGSNITVNINYNIKHVYINIILDLVLKVTWNVEDQLTNLFYSISYT